MKRTLLFGVLLALVAPASADIDLFLTRGTDFQYITAADRFNSNEKKFVFVAGAPSPGNLPHGPFTQDCQTEPLATYYVWAKFTNIPVGGAGSIQAYGLGLAGSYATPDPNAVSGVWYRLKNGTPFHRWDSLYAMPLPGNALAVDEQGVWTVYVGTASGYDCLMRDFDGDGSYYALLGAIRFKACGAFYLGLVNPNWGTYVRDYDADISVINDYDTGPGGFYPHLTIMGTPYTHEAGTQPILAISAQGWWYPCCNCCIKGDLNCDGNVGYADINAFVLALHDATGYAERYPNCDRNLADINGDGYIDYADINPFVRLLTGS